MLVDFTDPVVVEQWRRYFVVVEQWRRYFAERGYVQLDPDQTLPSSNIDVHSWRDYHPDWAYEKAQQDMLRAGWKKVRSQPSS